MSVPVMNGPSAPFAVLKLAAIHYGGTDWYLRALVALWEAGIRTGVDPAVLAGQCALETGWGRFGGTVDASFGNTAGMKIRSATGDTAADMARFAVDRDGYPRVGALAHAHHLAAYCGFPPPPDSADQRAAFVLPGNSNFGSVLYVEDLGGKWAPSPDYGVNVAAVVHKLRGDA